jgi:diaminohydroxyphosphoribosylaminopyrimidine deaminase/5-amino-6-(5-phosphoribosylamino)uracil reductase
VDTPRQPLRVVIDSRLETPLAAKVIKGGGTLIAAAIDDGAKLRALHERGVETLVCANAGGKVDLAALMRELARRGVNEVHVEAGHRLNGSLLGEGLVDELLVYLAPHLIGDAARGMFHLPELADLAGRRALEVRDVRVVGDDIRVIARVVNG